MGLLFFLFRWGSFGTPVVEEAHADGARLWVGPLRSRVFIGPAGNRVFVGTGH